jgi:hypothetical protein
MEASMKHYYVAVLIHLIYTGMFGYPRLLTTRGWTPTSTSSIARQLALPHLSAYSSSTKVTTHPSIYATYYYTYCLIFWEIQIRLIIFVGKMHNDPSWHLGCSSSSSFVPWSGMRSSLQSLAYCYSKQKKRWMVYSCHIESLINSPWFTCGNCFWGLRMA